MFKDWSVVHGSGREFRVAERGRDTRKYVRFSRRSSVRMRVAHYGHAHIMSMGSHGQIREMTNESAKATVIGKSHIKEEAGARGKQTAEWVRVRAPPTDVASEEGERRTSGERNGRKQATLAGRRQLGGRRGGGHHTRVGPMLVKIHDEQRDI